MELTQKEKALELINKYSIIYNGIFSNETIKTLAKQCAIIAVDEIIQAIRFTNAKGNLGYVGYWNNVKTEINNL